MVTKAITKIEAAEMAQLFFARKYGREIFDFSVYTEAGGSRAVATCKMEGQMVGEFFKVEVIIDTIYNSIESREYHHEDDLSNYRTA